MKKRITLFLILVLCGTQHVRAAELTRKEIEVIADQYVDAWNSWDLTALKAMYLDPDKLDSSQFRTYQANIKRVKSRGEDEGHFQVEFLQKDDNSGVSFSIRDLISNMDLTGVKWVLLTPDGKIKYDDVFIKHPIEFANKVCRDIENCFGRKRYHRQSDEIIRLVKSDYALLKETGIPLFKLDLNDDPDDVTDSLEEIMEWLEDNAESYDSSEPKVLLPYKFKLH